LLAGVEERIAVAEAAVSDQVRAQKRLDGDVEQVRARMQRDQTRLDDGSVSSPRELEQLQHEIESLRRRQSTLEDEELEIMEQVEQAQQSVDAMRAQEVAALAERAAAHTSRADAEQAVAIEAGRLRAERAEHLAEIPAELCKLYDKLRADGLGTAAAKLQRRTCQGCRMELASTELAEVAAAPTDEVLRCESCRCVLVRTSDSGLPGA
jgi:predicted  nucleic acid-binding Zn-ribbon protein